MANLDMSGGSEERPGMCCLIMHEIFRYIFHKMLHELPCLYAEDYTDQSFV